MNLKQIPEDFIVIEIPLIDADTQGSYVLCEMIKKETNTEDAVQEIARQLRIQRKQISYAGTKDRQAITTQNITINAKEEQIEKFKHEKITLNIIGKTKEPLSLGRLKGNKFEITIRNLDGTETINKEKEIINYFDEQRFSKNNTEVGKLLITKKYKEAINILEQDPKWARTIKEHLEKSKNDYVGALKRMPKKILTLIAHAYQSKIWNETIKRSKKIPKEIPIIGFEELNTDEETKKTIQEIMSEEQITRKDFLNKDIPYLTLEGTMRKTKQEIKNLKIGKYEEDELNKNKKKIKISFELEKGAYATTTIKQIINN